MQADRTHLAGAVVGHREAGVPPGLGVVVDGEGDQGGHGPDATGRAPHRSAGVVGRLLGHGVEFLPRELDDLRALVGVTNDLRRFTPRDARGRMHA